MEQFVEPLFLLSILLVFPFWLLMIGVPQWSVTRAVLGSPLVLLPLLLLYLVVLALNWPLLVYLIEDPTLTRLAVVLGEHEGALLAWMHLLAFDCFVGRWIYLDSQEQGLHFMIIVPVLWATLLLGPLGLLLYLMVRSLPIRPAEPPPGPPIN